MDPTLCLICNNPGPGLHRFPRERNRFTQWLKSINREDLLKNDESNVYKNGKVCNSHFADWCFVGKDKKKLGKHATPKEPNPPMHLEKYGVEIESPKQSSKSTTTKSDYTDQGNHMKQNCDLEVTQLNFEPSKEKDSSNKIISDNNDQDKCKFVVADEMTQNADSKQIRHVKKKNVITDKNEHNEKNDSETKKHAEKIFGATKKNGKLLLLIKWKDSDEADLVPSTIANRKFPEKVIEYYESRLRWNNEEIDNKENMDTNDHIM